MTPTDPIPRQQLAVRFALHCFRARYHCPDRNTGHCHPEAWKAVLEHNLSAFPDPSEARAPCFETEQAVMEGDETVRGGWVRLSEKESPEFIPGKRQPCGASGIL